MMRRPVDPSGRDWDPEKTPFAITMDSDVWSVRPHRRREVMSQHSDELIERFTAILGEEFAFTLDLRHVAQKLVAVLDEAAKPTPGGPLAAETRRPVDEIDVSGWGVFKGHAIPMAVARHIADKVNLYAAAMAKPAPGGPKTREGWQPIETAPTNGHGVLIHQSGAVFLAWYDKGIGWVDGIVDPMTLEPDVWTPTHWMPLPAPPEPTVPEVPARVDGEGE